AIPLGPADEKSAITESLVTAAAVIAFVASPGDEIEPLPKASKSLPAAIAGTTPAWAAALIAFTTMSRSGSTSGSPSERLITFIPSAAAGWITLTISGELPFSPTAGVGTVGSL